MTTIQDLLKKITEAYQNKKPFVAYKKPNEEKIQALFQKDSLLKYVKDYSEKGFVFAPFENNESAILISCDHVLEAEIEMLVDDLKEKEIIFPEVEEEKEHHLKFVNNTVAFLKEEAVSKIVIARSKKIKNLDFDFLHVFQKLVKKYPSANAYVWYHPKVGLWMGATPEMLLEIEDNNFKTMSLAGTQPYVDTVDVVWGNKEIEEQQMVTDYVLSNLKETTDIINNSKVYTVKAGSLLHLRTDISGIVKSNNGLFDMINVLHPTPAVCGFPREKAKQFILENENFNRSFYTGFLGELNMDNQTTLFVNLRCMEVLSESEVRLYVGGGITQKSEAIKEWEETVSKCQTMEKVL